MDLARDQVVPVSGGSQCDKELLVERQPLRAGELAKLSLNQCAPIQIAGYSATVGPDRAHGMVLKLCQRTYHVSPRTSTNSCCSSTSSRIVSRAPIPGYTPAHRRMREPYLILSNAPATRLLALRDTPVTIVSTGLMLSSFAPAASCSIASMILLTPKPRPRALFRSLHVFP